MPQGGAEHDGSQFAGCGAILMMSSRLETWHTVVFITLVSCGTVLAELPRDTWFTTAAVSLSLGASALALAGTAALLGGRWKTIETLFGGLDRVYRTHKWLGIWALAFASFHLVFQAELDEWSRASILALPRASTRFVRQLSFVALMLIVLLALNRNIPYHVWRLWHKLSGPLFGVMVLHWLSIRSPIALGSPAGIWLGAISALGLIAAFYKLLLYPFLSRHAEYRVVGASTGPAALHLELEPVGRSVPFKPGQFGFLRMKIEGLREPHPFTIVGSGSGDRVHFLIRGLGDYTNRLIREAAPGMHAEIYAPYGRFERSQDAKREVWIAGGVGISPFVAWLSDPQARRFDAVTFFYFFTPGREFPSPEVLSKMACERGAEFVSVPDGPASPAFLRRFGEIVAEAGPEAVTVSFCGPKGLLNYVRARMREKGIPEKNLHYEYFEFR